MHYVWFIGIAFWVLNPSMAMIWIIMSEFIAGTLLSLVFILNHNGKEVYNTSKDFVNAQVRESISFPYTYIYYVDIHRLHLFQPRSIVEQLYLLPVMFRSLLRNE